MFQIRFNDMLHLFRPDYYLLNKSGNCENFGNFLHIWNTITIEAYHYRDK